MALQCEVSRTKKEKEPKEEPKRNNNLVIWDVSATSSGLQSDIDTITFDADPLAEFLFLRHKQGYENPAIYEIISSERLANTYLTATPQEEDFELALAVRRHYKNKFLMWRLRGKEASKFQRIIEDIISDPLTLAGDNIAAFCKMYEFYLEDVAKADIFKKAVTLPDTLDFYKTDGIATFVGAVKRSSREQRHTSYYWLTEDRSIVVKEVKEGTSEFPVWEYLAKQGKVGIRGKLYIAGVPGHSFKLAKLLGANYEIFD